ncbi:MAG: VanZ family protein [Bacteroidia bacterium]|nr:VanZ family protein [Bacteroidia bacterium]
MFFRYSYPALLWAVFILLLTMTSGKEFPSVSLLSFDKIVHVFLFSVQSYLFFRAFIRQSRFPLLRYHPVVFSLLLSILIGAATELIQAFLFTDRSGDVFDFVANCIGTGTGVLIFILLYGKASYTR